ncbi:bifunctional PTS system fructose-specific transporter subunit IIA/HPr protein [Vibrio sinaloensis DSM 21326]|uniref:Multiphosphoryl transfer protein n=1 Tax=Vibrio sinaloensis DSM 21326 TaxID=945550 RepID=E8M5M4_PHOS4|nr:fused PTS fructose transporter subunit IIA/HPr protein [Vibrio sinaloensis]EGA70817.1 bifunctional PTS system fructose-specific transporter subunit IIA/HPr protein [Vibrio sinaloensis DSM 21326]
MLKLTPSDITLSQTADDKLAAIRNIALSLSDKELVDNGYVEGMLNREAQNSTYLGNGIAIPHGTTDTRSMVNTTGVAIHHFPEGVNWGDGNTAYVAIGIAAKSDEHLSILKQLTKVLAADGVESKLRQATSKEEIIALLQGNVQLEADLDAALIQVQFPASDMVQMSAVAAGLIKNAGNAQSEFVADLVTKSPTHLGQGLWLVGSNKAVSRTAVSYVSTANDCEFEGQPVKGLVAFAACNDAHASILANLSRIVFQGNQEQLLHADNTQVVELLSGNTVTQEQEKGNQATFKIKNAHGLHARPGAMLVAEAKKFESNIRVSNLDGDGKAVNAKSLMKVIALGVKHGHQLQFSAEGPDAALALESIGKAIASGLGEG